MRGTALLEELVRLAQRQNVVVRREPMTRGVSSGGLCVLNGVATLFVDERASTDAQIEVLAAALRRFDWSTTFLQPALRTLLHATGDTSAE